MKRFLLIAGDYYYPQAGTDDWVGFFDSRQEAEAIIKKENVDELFLKGPRKGEVKAQHIAITIYGAEVDWYDIVDLEEEERNQKWSRDYGKNDS